MLLEYFMNKVGLYIWQAVLKVKAIEADED